MGATLYNLKKCKIEDNGILAAQILLPLELLSFQIKTGACQGCFHPLILSTIDYEQRLHLLTFKMEVKHSIKNMMMPLLPVMKNYKGI